MAKKDINNVTLVGRLTRDAELKHTSGGMAICEFSLASNYTRKQGDEYVEEASFFDCVLFGRYAEAVHQYMTKKQQIVIAAEARQERWEKDGQKRSKVKFICTSVELVGGRDSGRPVADQGHGDSFKDDVPF